MLNIEARRFSGAVVIAGLLALQRLTGAHATGSVKLAAGLALSLALLVAVAMLASAGSGRWTIHVKPARLYVLLTLSLLLSAFSRETAWLFALLPSSPPRSSLAVLVGFWVAVLIWAARKGHSNLAMTVGLVGLVAGTRILNLATRPFDRLDGDMLPTIDRGLGELLAGRFPYVDFPPPMPYLPATFLAYLPPKLLGVDLRWANIALDALVALTTVYLARRLADRKHSESADPRPLLNQILLPASCCIRFGSRLGSTPNSRPASCARRCWASRSFLSAGARKRWRLAWRPARIK